MKLQGTWTNRLREPMAALRGAQTLAYVHDRSGVLRFMRLALDSLATVFRSAPQGMKFFALNAGCAMLLCGLTPFAAASGAGLEGACTVWPENYSAPAPTQDESLSGPSLPDWQASSPCTVDDGKRVAPAVKVPESSGGELLAFGLLTLAVVARRRSLGVC